VRQTLANHLLRLAWSFTFAKRFSPRQPVILLYHGVPAAADATLSARVFEQHIHFLNRHFQFVHPADLDRRRAPDERPEILLTFDDGFRNNAEVVAPILRRYSAPAIFFVASRHAVDGKYLWFSHLRALEDFFPETGFSFRGVFFNMSVGERRRSIQRLWKTLLDLRPHPTAMYQALEEELPAMEDFVSPKDLADSHAGMTAEQVAELSADPLFSIGGHTVDHPFLTRCDPAEAVRQMDVNRAWLEAVCGRRCDAFAYPSGDYSPELLDACQKTGFSRGYAVAAAIDRSSPFEIPRIGVYAASTDVLGFKAQWGPLVRRLRLPIG
jgi:peptidoglycan/xylan/chitin deacetylase (PgdA/CDA1 family)